MVAQEVNTLATRSATAAAQITGAMKGAIDRVESGVDIARKASDSFEEIVETVRTATGRIGGGECGRGGPVARRARRGGEDPAGARLRAPAVLRPDGTGPPGSFTALTTMLDD